MRRLALALGIAIGAAVLAGYRCAPPKLLIYADSLWDVGDVASCDLCGLLPADWSYRNFARNGAEVWSQRTCSGVPLPNPGCRNGFDRALRRGGVCRAEVQGVPTCIEDNWNATGPLLVAFTMNDVRKGADDAAWTQQNLAWIVDDTTSILEAKPFWMGCVLVVSAPIWENGDEVGGAEAGTYLQFNQRIEAIRHVYTVLAETHHCAIADIYQAYLDHESEHGEGATLPFYKNCPYKGADASHDCVHYSMTRPLLPALVIEEAVRSAYRLW